MLVVVIIIRGLIIYGEFIIDSTTGTSSVFDSWVDVIIKEIVKRRIWEALIGAGSNKVWGRLFFDTLLTEVVGLMMKGMERGMKGGTLLKKNMIGVFSSR